MYTHKNKIIILLSTICFLSIGLISLFKINSQYKPEDTEVWNPEPNIINPGNNNQPPSDAIILFDGKDLSKWKGSSGIFKGPIIIWKFL